MPAISIIKEIYDNPGYSLSYKLSEEDLAVLRETVERQFYGVIENDYPHLLEKFKEAGMANYHELSNLIDHSKTWPKLRRCLEQEACEKIKSLSFWKEIEREFSPFTLGRVVYEREVDWDRDEMYWRIVRPHEPNDVGTLHADKWFHDCMKIRERVFPEGANALKIWIPLYCEEGKNGLEIVQGSHKKRWDFSVVDIENTYKPRLNIDESTISRELLPTPAGQVVIFNEDIVHVGAVNKGNTTRISLEITLIRTLC